MLAAIKQSLKSRQSPPLPNNQVLLVWSCVLGLRQFVAARLQFPTAQGSPASGSLQGSPKGLRALNGCTCEECTAIPGEPGPEPGSAAVGICEPGARGTSLLLRKGSEEHLLQLKTQR